MNWTNQGKEINIQQQIIPKEKFKPRILKLTKRKSFGFGNINNDLFKYGGYQLIDQIHTLFYKLYDQKKVPEERKLCITIPVFEKREKMDLNTIGESICYARNQNYEQKILQKESQIEVNENKNADYEKKDAP